MPANLKSYFLGYATGLQQIYPYETGAQMCDKDIRQMYMCGTRTKMMGRIPPMCRPAQSTFS